MANNSFRVKNSLNLTPTSLLDIINPQAGDIACDINDNNKIKRYDANAAAWVEVGSGGVGGVDIFFVQDFESASLSSFTQTGLVLSQTDPLKGKVSALLTHQAGTSPSADRFFKQTISVDRKFRGQTMVLRLDSKSNASQGNLVINIKDETNNANLVASEQLQLSDDVNGRKTSVSFTIPESCASLSYTITALPESGKVSRIDDIICELSESALLETSVVVPNITAWQGYTPTFQGFGSPTNVEFEWRQVGENVEVRGKFVAGTTTAVEARVGLPAGLTSAGTNLIPSLQVIGKATSSAINAGLFGTSAVLVEPSVTYMTLGAESSSQAGTTKANGNFLGGAGTIVTFFASVPCAGLSATTTKTIPLTQSGLVQNPDSYLFVSGNAGQSLTASVTNIPFANIQLSKGDSFSFNGSQVTILKDGIFDFSATVVTSANVSTRLGLFKNGNLVSSGVGAVISTHSYTLSLSLITGDIISFRLIDNNGTLSNSVGHTLQVTQQGSLKQLSVSSDQKLTIPTSELRFEGASSRGSTATAIVKFDTMAKLRGDAFTVESDSVLGTRITMKKAGKLSVSASLYRSTGPMSVYITRNQSTLTSVTSTPSQILSATYANAVAINNPAWDGDVVIGDIIRISTDQIPTSDSANVFNLSFQEQDISVSVTNTLPQFSESDSSVRVDTANGYGSTATKIRRFSNVRDNIGSDITYNPNGDEAVNGASFRVNSAGDYNISYSDVQDAAQYFGISVNSTELTTDVQSITSSSRRGIAYMSTAGSAVNVSWEGRLEAGDIVRPHVSGAGATTATGRASFTISKVGKPNVTGVNVTPFIDIPQPITQEMTYLNTGTVSVGNITGALSGDTANGVMSYNSSTGIYTALKRCKVSASGTVRSGATVTGIRIYKNNTTLLGQDYTHATGGWLANAAGFSILNPGETLLFNIDNAASSALTTTSVIAEALSDQILTAPETFSTDTASLQYASSSLYNLTTLANAPVGTYITFTTASGGNTHTQTTTAPSQSPADMNVNGINIFSRARNAPSTAGNPARIAIQIGKGLQGLSLRLYKSTGKVNTGSLDFEVIDSAVQVGMMFKEYNEVTGILLLDSSTCWNSTNTSNSFNFSDFTQQTSGYLVINASKNPALTGLNVLLPRIATLSDVKASGTAGGTATSGSYQTRTLNTLSDPTGIVTSLASNQFTLPAGEYYIDANAFAFNCELHKLRIQNITDSTTSLLGAVAYSRVISNAGTTAFLSGNIVLNSAKTFELQHRVGTTQASSGFGLATSFGDNEVYASIKITKVK